MKKVLYLASIIALFGASSCADTSQDEVSEVVEESLLVTDTLTIKLEHVNELLVQNPNDFELIKQRAELLYAKGEIQQAFSEANKIVKARPSDESAQLLLGNVAFDMGQYTASFDAYTACITENPKNTDCLIALAEFSMFRDKKQDAMNYVNSALKVDEQLYYPYYLKGNIYLALGDSAKAVSSYRTAVELEPDFYEGYMLLGTIYADARMDVSIEYFKSALTVRENDAFAKYSIAMFYQNNDRVPQAMKTYDEIIEVNPDFKYAYYNKGYLYLTEYLDFDSAIAYFSSAVAQDPEYKEAYYNRGIAKEEMGKKVEAAADFQFALSIDGQYTQAAKALNRVQ